MHRFFISIFWFIQKNKISTVLVAMTLLAVCGFFGSKIHFEEDINQIIPKNDKSDITAKVLKQLNFSDQIVVIIEQKGDTDEFALSETADSFLDKITPLKKYINNVQGKVDEEEITQTFDFVNQNLPLFLNDNDYREISQKLNSDSIAKKVEQNYAALVSPTSLVTKNFIKKDPLGISFLGLKKLESLNMGNDFRLENNYIVTKDGKHLLLFIEPKFGGAETKNNEVFADGLDSIKDQLNQQFKGKTEISYFGSPIIAVANAKQIKSDIQKTVVIALVVLLALLIFYFRNLFTPIIIFLPTVFAVGIALCSIYFLRDRISAISLSVGAILLGITVDYALHVLTHLKKSGNIEELYREITQPVLMSSFTTAISFLCLVFVHSEALIDLGIFASISVLSSSFFALIIVPQLYHPKEVENQKPNFIDRIGSYDYDKNKFLLIFCSIVIIACFFGFSKVKFNENIGNLNFVPDEMKKTERKLEQLSDITSKSIYTVSYGKSEAEALEKNTQLFEFLNDNKTKNGIISFSSVGEVVLSKKEQQEKIEKWNSFWNAERKKQVTEDLVKNGNKFGFNENAFSDFQGLLTKTFEPISLDEYQTLKPLQLQNFINEKDGLYTVSNIVKIDEKSRDQFIKSVEEKGGIIAIDRQQMNENFLGLLKKDFGSLINYSLIAIVLILFVFFRKVELTMLAMVPIILTGIVTAGILYFFGMQLNIFSTIVCTLVFGVGVDFSIFLTQALMKENTTGKNVLPTYRTSIILAVLTTVLAIGTLIFAKHPALHSVASVALIGMFSVLIITFSLYPFLFRLLIIKRQKKGLSQLTLRLFLHSVLSFAYYGIGGFLFSLFGHFFVPKAGKKGLLSIKKTMAAFLKSVLYSNPFVKKKVINPNNETFEKPAVIIANHTSFLDTLVIAMVTHKAVFLVNDWVYNSPVFGKMVRALGFYPVSQGIENGTEQLREKVEQGFSLMVFPEATRSSDNNVKRFHKGAFYLAEEFGLDILPIYIHGNSEVLPKNDYIIYNGSITAKVGNRISNTDLSFGKNYSERGKNINRLFREEFAKLRTEIEDEDYFKEKLFLSFLYKDSEVVAEVKNDFNANKKKYHALNSLIGKDDVVLHFSSDFGQKDILLTLQEASRTVYSFNSNLEKREIAKQNHNVKTRKIFYIDSLSEMKKSPDVLLISDKDFDWKFIETIPKKVVFLNVEPFFPEHTKFLPINNYDGIFIYGIE